MPEDFVLVCGIKLFKLPVLIPNTKKWVLKN